MNQIIRYLGTPRIYTEILAFIDEDSGGNQGCFFREKAAANKERIWILEDAMGVSAKKYQYESFDEIKDEFAGFFSYDFFDETQLLVKKELSKDCLEHVGKTLEIQGLYAINEEKEEEISRLTYSINGMDTIIESLLEPLQTVEFLTILCDAFGELLISPSALYKRDAKAYKLIHNHGFTNLPQSICQNTHKGFSMGSTFPVDIVKNTVYDELEPLKEIYKTLFLVPVQIEGNVDYYILVGRSSLFSEVERLILSNLSRLLSSIIEYHTLREQVYSQKMQSDSLGFRLQAFYKGLKYLFSVQELESFCEKFIDMIKEIFQIENAKLFVRQSWGNLLWGYDMKDVKHALSVKYNTVWDSYNLKDKLEYDAFQEDFGNINPFLNSEEQKGTSPDSAHMIRGVDGNVLGIVFICGSKSQDKEFLQMICEMAGLVLEIIIAHKDFNKVIHSYEEVMEAFQGANELYKKIAKCNGVVDFYNIMKKNLIRNFGITNMYISFKVGEKSINFPKNLEKEIMDYFEEYYQRDYADTGIFERENGSILFILPIPVISKKILLAFEGSDTPRLNVLLQLMQLGFQDQLAAILEEEY